MTALLTGSRGRVSLPLLRWAPDPTVLVEPAEVALYEEAHPDVEIVSLPEGGRGFGYLLNRMVDRTLAAGDRYFIFTDDDVTDLRSRPDVESKFSACRGAAARDALADLVALAADGDLAQYAVSFAGGSWSAKKPTVEPSGAWGVHVTDARVVELLGGYDETLPIFNDWEMSARMIEAGFRCARTNLVTFVHRMRSHDGGAADLYDRADLVRSAAERVHARYPHASRVVHIDAHGLDEVRFSWRRLAPDVSV